MCLTGPILVSKCTDKDIVCYKIESRNAGESNTIKRLINVIKGKSKLNRSKWSSPYYDFIYKKGKKYSLDSEIEVCHYTEFETLRTKHVINKAFHSYVEKGTAKESFNWIWPSPNEDYRIVKCIIPAGSELYTDGLSYGEYASSAIIVL